MEPLYTQHTLKSLADPVRRRIRDQPPVGARFAHSLRKHASLFVRSEQSVTTIMPQKRHLDRLLEYLVKDSLGTDGPTRDDTEFTDARCEKVNVDAIAPSHSQSFLTSNTTHLHSLLQHYNGSIVETVMRIFVHNNSRHTMNNYELSLFLRTLFVKLPNDILPYIDYDDVGPLSPSPSDSHHEQSTHHQPRNLRHPRPPPHLPRETLPPRIRNTSRRRN